MIINLKVITNLLGTVLLLVAATMSVPTIYAFVTVTRGSAEFLFTASLLIVLGLIIKRLTKTSNLHMTLKDMFFFTTSVWTAIIVTASLPIMLTLKTDYITACFETASAVSTTGITVLQDIDNLPPAILLWRSMMQYFGGIGFIAVGIAVLPNLNVGGMKLFRTESSEQGSDRVTPKSKTIAKGILILYLSITIIAFLVYMMLGMNAFDAINHAMTAIATGGMSTHEKSMDYFSESIQWFTILIMFIGALPFQLMIISIRQNITMLFKDAQVRGFIFLITITSLAVTLSLIYQENLDVWDAFRFAIFSVVDILSSTGYSMGDYSSWNDFITLIFLIILPIGACSGSTSSGLKIFRLQIAFTLFKRQINQLQHPSAIFPQKYNGQPVNETIIRSIIAFFFAYLSCLVISSLLLSITGIQFVDSISASISCLSNIGMGIGENFGPQGNFTNLNIIQKLILMCDMVMGRLEVLTILICLLPSFWKL